MDIRALAYLAIETPTPDEWSAYLTGVVGLMEERDLPGCDPDARYFRTDARAYRFSIKASKDETYTVGWEVPSASSLSVVASELAAAGVMAKEGNAETAAARGVGGLLMLEDPFGNPLEVVWGHQSAEAPFHSPAAMSGFSSEGGFGHVLYAVTSSARALEFYGELLGFAPTDYFTWGSSSAWFLRCNSRHHTVAFFDLDIAGGPGINHVMLEANTLADVGRALDRSEDAGVEIVNSLGQHSNDQTVSFYMRSPGRTNVELGVGQVRIDAATHQVTSWSGKGDLWGHRGRFMGDIAAELA
jgi:3,4-dihydroxy-9,10-secoandrosta-1,3,5(10)-triene-9,17-dione 4,5-dioxygenase